MAAIAVLIASCRVSAAVSPDPLFGVAARKEFEDEMDEAAAIDALLSVVPVEARTGLPVTFADFILFTTNWAQLSEGVLWAGEWVPLTAELGKFSPT